MAVFKDLKEEIGDLSILQVNTFTGNLKAVVKTSAQGGAEEDKKSIIDWDKLLEEARTEGEISLAAASKINIDGDTLQFVNDTASEGIREAHKEAVVAALHVRSGLLTAFRDLFGLKK